MPRDILILPYADTIMLTVSCALYTLRTRDLPLLLFDAGVDAADSRLSVRLVY